MKNINLISRILLGFPVLLILNGCGIAGNSFISSRSESDLEMLARANNPVVNNIDPRGNGTVDPKMVTELGKTKIYFNQGDLNLSLKLKLGNSPISVKSFKIKEELNDQTLNQEYQKLLVNSGLKDLSYVEATVTVNDQTIQVKANAGSLAADLSHTLEIIGLAKNSKVKIKGTAFDKDNKSIGSGEYEKVITDKDNTEELNIKIDNIEQAIKG